MIYQTTITKKGQITIPKEIRDILKLEEGKKLEVELDKKEIRIKPAPDILELAGKFKTKRKIDVVKARELMERYYGYYEKERG
jgi:AbrB family looped-hinge helix DNA binding protein